MFSLQIKVFFKRAERGSMLQTWTWREKIYTCIKILAVSGYFGVEINITNCNKENSMTVKTSKACIECYETINYSLLNLNCTANWNLRQDEASFQASSAFKTQTND